MSGPPFVMSETADEVVPAFARAVGQLHDVVRAQVADTGSYSYAYADLGAVLDVARPVLAAEGLAVAQVPTLDPAAHLVSVTTVVMHTSGQTLTFAPLTLPTPGQTVHAIGSAVTYARRYSLMAVLGIAAEDDDGAATRTPPAKKKAAAKKKAPPPDDRIPVAAAKGKLLELLGGDADLARELWPSSWTSPVDRVALDELLDDARRRLTEEPPAVLEVRDLAERAGLDADALLDVAETVTDRAVHDLGELDADELAALRDRLHATLADQLADEHGGDPT